MTDDDLLQRLKWSISALAQPAEVQKKLFPPFVCVSDELALEFDEFHQQLRRRRTLPPASRELLLQIDEALEQMSGVHQQEMWTDQALQTAAEWERVRALARELITQMNWSPKPPPLERNLYVGPDA